MGFESSLWVDRKAAAQSLENCTLLVNGSVLLQHWVFQGRMGGGKAHWEQLVKKTLHWHPRPSTLQVPVDRGAATRYSEGTGLIV